MKRLIVPDKERLTLAQQEIEVMVSPVKSMNYVSMHATKRRSRYSNSGIDTLPLSS